MLSWFVQGFTDANSLTPTSILVLFIVSVLALAWAILTLFFYHRSKHNARFVALVDILLFGALIAGVYFLRGIASVSCTNVYADRSNDWTVDLGDVRVTGPGYDVGWRTEKRCAMLKASFAFAIINVVLFFVTAVAAFLHGGAFDHSEYTTTTYRSKPARHHHSSRHSHRSSHSGSRHSRNSHTYV